MNENILDILKQFISLDNWDSIHLKVNIGDRRNEVFFTNPTMKEEVIEPVVEAVEEPVVVEGLSSKIERFRNAAPGALTYEEELWWKERQKELEEKHIGQITSDDSPDVALSKLRQIGIE